MCAPCRCRRMNKLPDHPGIVRAVMHLFLYVGPVNLGYNDTVVMSFGLHYHNRADQLTRAVAAVLEWWFEERAAGRAPQLLWRPTSPQHFATPTGQFEKYDDIVTTTACRTDLTMAETGSVYPDSNFSMRFRDIDTAWRNVPGRRPFFHVLPGFAASLARHDEHPLMVQGSNPLSAREIDKLFRSANVTDRRRPDCSHFCTPSSTIRLWSQIILAWLHHIN